MTPKRVLLLSYEFAPFRGGIARVVEAIAAGAASLGHDVHVLAPDYLADQSAADSQRTFTVHRFPGDFCSILSIDKLTRFANLCRKAIARIAPEVVHAADPQSHMALTLLSRLGLAPGFSVTVHGTELLRYRRETLPRLWMRHAFRQPRAIFPVSNAIRQLLVNLFEVDNSRVHVAYPAVASLWFETPPADPAAVRRQWGVPDDAFVLITVARRVPDKGHAQVIDALSRLPDTDRARVVYIVAGKGPEDYARRLQSMAERSGVRALLAGETDELATVALVDSADLFIMTSHQTPARLEGFGIAYLEAAARGLPSIALDTGGVREAVIHLETGFLLPQPCSPDDLADAIRRACQQPELLQPMRSRARAHARAFTPENLARTVLA